MNNLKFLVELFTYWVKGKNPTYEIFLNNKIALDVACGEGHLLQKNPELIYGIDINASMVKTLKQKGLRIKEGNVTSLPYDDEFFEVVHCSNIIEHLAPNDAQMMLCEIYRVLKPGGIVILVTPMPKTIWYSFGHVKPYTPQAIKKLFRPVSMESFNSITGFQVKNIFYYGTSILNRITFLLSTVLANIMPSAFAGSYLMIIKKNER